MVTQALYILTPVMKISLMHFKIYCQLLLMVIIKMKSIF